ncbi:hypothetical protein BCE75_11211 [Isoptericola sp. CG 20/1183]|uniref:DUF421 domain-containing protein n=1 Tax=Isoptericola halotolerans TaxID=300560 RepID=A0ABX5EDJ3_9MICO|nr:MULTISPECIES: YetF domain-containing protein [Isoptericola]PRZ03792.1 hypothetical protein BCE75_11211 [Isoptericola sp. CG 20/1183]PRZ04075.1 hypothetical protein BCL65_111109 [Isoptericola halotolerans]
MWFDDLDAIWRVLAVGAGAYAALVVLLRVTGKRTLSKLNAFDFVVTIALGSTLATVLLNADVSWAEGVTALALLAGLQLVVSWIVSRRPKVAGVVTSGALVVLRDGVPDLDALRRARLTQAELAQSVRRAGFGGYDVLAAVVLESDGSLSVVPASKLGDAAAIEPLERD